jgi:hypothetical protein
MELRLWVRQIMIGTSHHPLSQSQDDATPGKKAFE